VDWDNSYWSAGKLLISSEYLVIDGAKALAIPSRFGQDLKVKKNDSGIIHWVGKTVNQTVWLDVKLDGTTLAVIDSNNSEKAERLSKILKNAKAKSAKFPTSGAFIETNLEFPRDWGLGSSSTLLCNVAKWLDIDAFQLHFASTNGSGYDIACGLAKFPLTYTLKDQNASFETVSFDPHFKNHIYFVHLNQKQFSDQEVAKYSSIKKEIDLEEAIRKFTTITEQLLTVSDLTEFENLLEEHEHLLSHILQRETIRESLFQLYTGGAIKSLGAWGGDFVMVTAKQESDLSYFKEKGFNTILSFNEMFAYEND
jgi:mevalonate kinase